MYDLKNNAWQEKLMRELLSAISDALSPIQTIPPILTDWIFYGRYLQNFDDVISSAQHLLEKARNYFYVTRTSPNAAILLHEDSYFETTRLRIKGNQELLPLPNYRRIVNLNSRDDLRLATGQLQTYWDCPNFQMAVISNRFLPINFELFLADDKWALITFGAENSPGPIDSGMLVENSKVAIKWKSFFLYLWDHPQTVTIKCSGSMTEGERDEALLKIEQLFDRNQSQ